MILFKKLMNNITLANVDLDILYKSAFTQYGEEDANWLVDRFTCGSIKIYNNTLFRTMSYTVPINETIYEKICHTYWYQFKNNNNIMS